METMYHIKSVRSEPQALVLGFDDKGCLLVQLGSVRISVTKEISFEIAKAILDKQSMR